jgi:hypothetical protein
MTSVDRQALLDKLAEGFLRLEVPSLTKQRFTASESKAQELSSGAMGAKLDKALDRRLSNQDAEPPKALAKALVKALPKEE